MNCIAQNRQRLKETTTLLKGLLNIVQQMNVSEQEVTSASVENKTTTIEQKNRDDTTGYWLDRSKQSSKI